MFGSLECFPFSEQCKVIMKCDRLRGRGETMLLSEKSSRFFFLRDLLRVPLPPCGDGGGCTYSKFPANKTEKLGKQGRRVCARANICTHNHSVMSSPSPQEQTNFHHHITQAKKANSKGVPEFFLPYFFGEEVLLRSVVFAEPPPPFPPAVSNLAPPPEGGKGRGKVSKRRRKSA